MDDTFDVEVHFTFHLPHKMVNKLIEYAEEQGYGYKDPGKVELLRRLLIAEGTEGIESALGGGILFCYTIH